MSGAAPLVAAPRARALRRRLLAWWDAGHRDLPWRAPQGGADGYRVWLSEVMLQQTRVEAVVPYYARFLARFPTLASLSAASEDEVLALWSGLGYYARGRRLREAARAALVRHGGLPADPALLAALPGFGPYTAGAVASIAFGVRAACVDGNVARVLARLFLVEGRPEDAAVRARLAALADLLVPPARPGDWNQALMELGALVCVKPVPRCGRCPLAGACRARREGREREVPPARARRAPRELRVACALVEREGDLLLARRPPGGLFGGLWALPGGEWAAGDDPRAALAAALRRDHGLRAQVGEEVASVERALTHRRLRLTAFRAAVRRFTPGRELRFHPWAGLAELGLAAATRALLAAAGAARAESAVRPRGTA